MTQIKLRPINSGRFTLFGTGTCRPTHPINSRDKHMDNKKLDGVIKNFLSKMIPENQKLMELFSEAADSSEKSREKLKEAWELVRNPDQSPTEKLKAFGEFQKTQLELWSGLLGSFSEKAETPAPGDRRFESEEWSKSLIFQLRQRVLPDVLSHIAENSRKAQPGREQEEKAGVLHPAIH